MELGLAGRPLTRDELILVHGGVVEPSREGRVQWAPDTVEAALAVDICAAEWEQARVVFAEIRARAVEELKRLGRQDSRDWRNRKLELEDVIAAARDELGEVGERLRVARRVHRELNARDSAAHVAASHRAAIERRNEERKAAKTASRKSVLLARFRG